MGNSKRVAVLQAVPLVVAENRARSSKLSLNCMTVQQKFDILESQEHEKSLQKIAELHNCNRSAIQKINEDREAIILCYQRLLEQNMDPNEHKKVKPNVKSVDLEHHMSNFVLECKQHGVELTGTSMKQHALQVAQQLGLMDFKASDGWLEKFKQRHNVFPDKPVKRRRKMKVAAAFATSSSPTKYYASSSAATDTDQLPTMVRNGNALNRDTSQRRSDPGMLISVDEASAATQRLAEYVLQRKPEMINGSLLDIRAWLDEERHRQGQLQQLQIQPQSVISPRKRKQQT